MNQADSRDISASSQAPSRAWSVLRQWPTIVVCAVLAGLAAYWVSSTRPKSYTATAVLQVASPDVLAQLDGEVAPVSTDVYDRDASTIAALVDQPAVRDGTSKILHGQLSPAHLSSAEQVVVQNNANLVNVSVSASSPQLAAAAANATVTTFLTLRHSAQVRDNLSAQAQIRAQLRSLGRGAGNQLAERSLRQRLALVEARAAVGTDVSLAQNAEAGSTTVSPLTKRIAIVGLLAGALIGVGIALARPYLADRAWGRRGSRGREVVTEDPAPN